MDWCSIDGEGGDIEMIGVNRYLVQVGSGDLDLAILPAFDC